MTAPNLELRHDYEAGRLAWHNAATGQIANELILPSTPSGCAIEEFKVSPSGNWIVTSRSSGQGEWGYDVIQSHPLRYMAGVPERAGYMLELPEFAPDESYILGGFGECWLGGWWSHPDDDFYETPARGGSVTFGWLFRHALPSQEVTLHELRMIIPIGWMPNDPDDEMWLGPRLITPVKNGGFEMMLPGHVSFEYAGPLAGLIELPVPHPGGGKLF